MAISYDKQRPDITFCTMLFKLPQEKSLNSLKNMDRKFSEFYLPSLKKLIETFGTISLWCDAETAQYLKTAMGGGSNKIDMQVMKFSDLPHYCEREKWLDTLNKMYGKRGYLFHHKTPADWIDYLILIAAKPWVVRDAATRNKFKSKYFMWIDAGALNPMYAGFWDGWRGKIDAHPDRIRMTIAPTLGKPRPRFVPRFIYDLYQFIIHTSAKYIPNATADTLARQSLTDIAMINAEYDVPASSFMVPHDMANDFWAEFERARKIMLRHNLVSTEQAVFQTMMKFDVNDMFEVCYIRGYTGVYTAVARNTADAVL